MLSETKDQIQNMVNKIQVLDFVLNTLNLSHKDHADEVEKRFKQASAHKLKLAAEILRLSNAAELEEVK